MIKVIALLSTGLLAFAFGGGAQRPQQTPDAAAGQQRTATHEPTPPGQPDRAEKAARAHEKMEKYVDVKITPVVYRDVPFSGETSGYVPTQTFKVGGEVAVAVSMTNRSDQALNAFNLSRFLHNRLRLVKDGVPVRYLSDVPVKMKAVEANAGIVVSTREVTLEPNVETSYDQFDLRDWYGTLQPGHYELTLRHRFRQGGKQVESNTVTFDVVP
ncbi:MAG TPA: hypothetical protein VF591_21605 [Pyrinomonadaceae bacterium]|jgi:hypothetical protein